MCGTLNILWHERKVDPKAEARENSRSNRRENRLKLQMYRGRLMYWLKMGIGKCAGLAMVCEHSSPYVWIPKGMRINRKQGWRMEMERGNMKEGPHARVMC